MHWTILNWNNNVSIGTTGNAVSLSRTWFLSRHPSRKSGNKPGMKRLSHFQPFYRNYTLFSNHVDSLCTVVGRKRACKKLKEMFWEWLEKIVFRARKIQVIGEKNPQFQWFLPSLLVLSFPLTTVNVQTKKKVKIYSRVSTVERTQD